MELQAVSSSRSSPTKTDSFCGSLGQSIQAAWHANISRRKGVCEAATVYEPVHEPLDAGQFVFERQDPAEQAVLFFHESFACPVDNCLKVFTSSKSYRQHRVNFHRLSRFTCIVCSEPFNSYLYLLLHMDKEAHHIQCTQCIQVFKSPSQASSHFVLKHKIFRCIYCSVPVDGKLKYNNHIQLHSAEESALLAASYVETAMNSSFCEFLYDKGETQINEDHVEEVAAGSPSRIDYDLNLDTTTKIYPQDFEIVNLSSSKSDLALAPNVTSINELTEWENISLPLSTYNEPSKVSDPLSLEPSEDGSNAPAFNISPSGKNQWIGHNVQKYRSMSEKLQKMRLYKCKQCSDAFKTKLKLKKHQRIHKHVCKCCCLQFDSVTEYKTHLKKHKSSKKSFLCSMCNHSLQDLQSLMVHEMRHRLNLAFKRKVEEALISYRGQQKESDYNQCNVCQEFIKGFSLCVRHEVWHNWSHMWTSYVVGRIFKGTFKEEDTIRFRKAVETELIETWRDCSVPVKDKFESKSPYSMKDTQNVELDNNEANYTNNELLKVKESDTNDNKPTLDETQVGGDDESESEAESEISVEGISTAVNGWMSYWCSYLGLDKSPPAWMKPILKELRSQWKNYHADNQDELYRQMDQIGILVRAERNETSGLDSPRVVLERLSSSLITQKMRGHLALQKCASSDAGTNKSADASKFENSSSHSGSSSTSTLSWSACQESTEDWSQPTSVKQIKFTGQDKNLDVNSSCRKIVWRSPAATTSGQEPESPILSVGANTVKQVKSAIPNTPEVVDISDDEEEGTEKEEEIAVTGSPLSWKECHLGIGRPLNTLSNLNFDSPTPLNNTAVSSTPVPLVESTMNLTNTSTPPRSFLQSIAWTRKEIGNKPIPIWAVRLLNCVCSNRLISPIDKVHKLRQIVCLLKAQSGDGSNTKLMPVVRVPEMQSLLKPAG